MNSAGVSFLIALLLAASITAIADPVPDTLSSSLEGRQWRLSQYYVGNKLPVTLPLRVPIPYLVFRDGKIEGSAGCGQFAGAYRGTNVQLAIQAIWEDDTKSACSGPQKREAAEILHALTAVRRIQSVSNALLLQDEKGALQVRLAAMQPGEDLSEIHDTFWLLKQVDNTTQNLSQVIVEIEQTGITFSTPSYLLAIPLQYHLWTGLEFYKPHTKGGNSKSNNYSQDQQVANLFEGALQKSKSYSVSDDHLTFFDANQSPTIVLSVLQPTEIEDRNWRIVKYRADNSDHADKDGLISVMEPARVLFMNGRVSGTPGAGGWDGTYNLSGHKLTFNASYFYSGAFAPEELDQSAAVSKALNTQLWIEKKGEDVLLRDDAGNARALLVPF